MKKTFFTSVIATAIISVAGGALACSGANLESCVNSIPDVIQNGNCRPINGGNPPDIGFSHLFPENAGLQEIKDTLLQLCKNADPVSNCLLWGPTHIETYQDWMLPPDNQENRESWFASCGTNTIYFSGANMGSRGPSTPNNAIVGGRVKSRNYETIDVR